MTAGKSPDGTVGNVSVPLTPGFVVPSGYYIVIAANGMNAHVWVTGYLVPSSDAPATPQVVTNGKMSLLQQPSS